MSVKIRRRPVDRRPLLRQDGGGVAHPHRWWALPFAAALALCAPTLASAQSASYFDRNNAGGVLQRPRPDYQALGIDAGGFQVFPSLTLSPEYDDNIYAAPDDRASDLVTNISPSLQVRSNWSRDELDAFANLSSNIYANHSNESTTDYTVGGSGRLDILSQSSLNASFSYAHDTEARTSENTVNTASAPVQFDVISTSFGGVQTLNRLKFTESFNFERITYDDTTSFGGAPIPLNTLDGDIFQVTGRADYAINPQISLFLSAQANDRPYDDKPPVASLDRDSSGYETTIGADFDITRLVRGQVQVGYLAQNYASPLFRPVNGPTVHARVSYFLSGLTTLTFTADRQVIDAVDPVAVSFLQTRGGLQVDHELLRNVILSALVGYETDTFKGEERDDKRASASASVTYLLNRRVGLTGTYSFLNEDSAGADRIGPYTVNVLSLSLVLQF